MKLAEYFKIAAAVIGSVGGSALIIGGFANWLGKVWADRLMAKEKASHDQALEELRDKLRLSTEKQLSEVNHWFAIQKETYLKHHSDKIIIYRAVIDIISEILRELEKVSSGRQPSISPEVLEKFSMSRLQAYGYLAMLAPQSVMDCFDALTDLLLGILYDGKKATWFEIRSLAIELLNAVRADLALIEGPIQYRGQR